MKAVILAAGEGQRMRPLTLETPKPLLEVADKPLLEHIIDALPQEIDEIILVVGYLKDQIIKRFGKQFGRFKIRYVEQGEKLGNGHALFLCKDLLLGERFLVLFADDLQSPEALKKMISHPLSMMVKEVSDPRRFGVVETDERGNAINIIEKPESPPTNLAATGAYVLDSRVFAYPLVKHEKGEYFLTDVVTQMALSSPIKTVSTEFWIPIGYPEDLKKAEAILWAGKLV